MDGFMVDAYPVTVVSLGSQESRSSLQLVSAVNGLRLGLEISKMLRGRWKKHGKTVHSATFLGI